jgi:outer membrane protein
MSKRAILFLFASVLNPFFFLSETTAALIFEFAFAHNLFNPIYRSNLLMKKIPLFIALIALVVSLAALYSTTLKTQLVYVDVNRLMDGYKRAKQVDAELTKKTAKVKATVDTLMNKWQAELRLYEKEKGTYSPKELKLKQELLGNKQQQLNAYQQSMQKQVGEERSKATQTLINDINDYLKEYGKKHSYKIIFGASGSGNIMYADESTDLTGEVLKGLNASYVKK